MVLPGLERKRFVTAEQHDAGLEESAGDPLNDGDKQLLIGKDLD